MRTSLASFLLLSLFLLSIFSTVLTIVNGKNKHLINETCNKSAQGDPNLTYKFCVTSLQSAPDSLCAGLKQLGTISIRLVKFNATNTRCHIEDLLSNNNTKDPFTRRALQDCLELYSDALPSLRKASQDFKLGKYLDANIEVSAAMDAPTTCEDGFMENKGVKKSPLTQRNKNMFELSALALSIIDIVQNQK